MVRLMMIKMVKGIKLVTKVTISDVMIRFIATKVKDPPRSKIHQGQRSRSKLTSLFLTNCHDPGFVRGSSTKFGTGYRGSDTSLGRKG